MSRINVTLLFLTLFAAATLVVTGQEATQGYLGIYPGEDGSGGVRIDQVVPGSPAAKAGLEEGDVILKVDDVEVGSPEELIEAVRGHRAGDAVAFTLRGEDGEQTRVETITLARRGDTRRDSEFFDDEDLGPDAALALEKSLRGSETRGRRSTGASPVDLERCRNITQMSPDLWTKEDILADFERTRTEDQVGVVVFVKTELCHGNRFRLCAVTTAALEKQATAILEHYKVYGAWIKSNPEHTGQEWRKWEREVIREYGFVQGPGARIVVLVPYGDEGLHVVCMAIRSASTFRSRTKRRFPLLPCPCIVVLSHSFFSTSI